MQQLENTVITLATGFNLKNTVVCVFIFQYESKCEQFAKVQAVFTLVVL